MSRRKKNLRAFLHQNPHLHAPDVEEAWDAAWDGAQKCYHSKRMNELEQQLASAKTLAAVYDAQLAELQTEVQEQARLLDMSATREAKLGTELAELRVENERLKDDIAEYSAALDAIYADSMALLKQGGEVSVKT